MKNKKNLRRILTLAAVAAMLITTAAASATITTKTIEASYMGIKLVIDGVEITPKDAKGKVVDPFISSGTTYLPVRAVGEALGKEVTWDGDTKTVYIGKVPGEEENWMTKLPPYQVSAVKVYDGSDRKATFNVAGETQSCGLVAAESWGKPFAIWNTNAEYSTMTLTIGHISGTNDMKLEVYLDSEYSTEYQFKWDGAPKSINIPLKYAPNVKLLFTGPEGGGLLGDWGIYDISFS